MFQERIFQKSETQKQSAERQTCSRVARCWISVLESESCSSFRFQLKMWWDPGSEETHRGRLKPFSVTSHHKLWLFHNKCLLTMTIFTYWISIKCPLLYFYWKLYIIISFSLCAVIYIMNLSTIKHHLHSAAVKNRPTVCQSVLWSHRVPPRTHQRVNTRHHNASVKGHFPWKSSALLTRIK